MRGALVLALLIVALLVATMAVFGIPVLSGLQLLYEGAFGDRFAWSRTAVKTAPLLLTGLGMVVAWRAGMFNIGGEGQLLVGGLASAALYPPREGFGNEEPHEVDATDRECNRQRRAGPGAPD